MQKTEKGPLWFYEAQNENSYFIWPTVKCKSTNLQAAAGKCKMFNRL